MSQPLSIDGLGNLRGLEIARLGLRWSTRKLMVLDVQAAEQAWHLTFSGGNARGSNASGNLDIHIKLEESGEYVSIAEIPFDVLEKLGEDFEEQFQVWLEKTVVAEMRPVSAQRLAAESWRLALMFPSDIDHALGSVARKHKRRLAIDPDALERLEDLPTEALVGWYERALHHPRCLSDLTADERRGQVMAMRPVEGGVEMIVLVWAPNPDGVWHWWSMPFLTDLPSVFGELLFKPAFEILSPYLADGLGRLVNFLERQAGVEPGERLRALPAAMRAGVSWDEAQDLLEQFEEDESDAAESNDEHDEALRALWLKSPRRSIERPERNEVDDK